MCAFHEHLEIYTLILHVLALRAHITKICMLLLSAKIFEASSTKSAYPDQTAPIGAI